MYIPKSWNDIDIDTFIELHLLSKDNQMDEDELNINISSILLDLSIQEIEELNYEVFKSIITDLGFLLTPPKDTYKQYISTPAGILYFNEDFNQYTIGEFIDLNNLFNTGCIPNLKVILSILYRVKTIKKSLLYPDEYEKYGNWIYHRESLFSEIKITDVYGIINKFIKYRENFFEIYQGLFEDPIDPDAEEPNLESMSHSERNEYKKAEAKEKTLHKWNWDILLYKLANNDPLKLEEATNINLIQAFNTLSMQKELNLNS